MNTSAGRAFFFTVFVSVFPTKAFTSPVSCKFYESEYNNDMRCDETHDDKQCISSERFDQYQVPSCLDFGIKRSNTITIVHHVNTSYTIFRRDLSFPAFPKRSLCLNASKTRGSWSSIDLHDLIDATCCVTQTWLGKQKTLRLSSADFTDLNVSPCRWRNIRI